MWEHSGWRAAMVAFLALGCGGERGGGTMADDGDDPVEQLGSSSAAIVINPCASVTPTVFPINVGTITDHARGNTTGSIAWYFKTYGQCHTYVLGAGVFWISAGVKVPIGATLMAQTGSATRIRALASQTDPGKWTMIQMSNHSKLSAIVADGDSRPNAIVNADSTDSVSISDCTLRESKGHVITADRSSRLSVRSSTVSHAGILSTQVVPTTSGSGHGINCHHCFDFEVKDTTVAFTRSAGIYMAGTLGAVIARNQIFETSWNMRYAEWAPKDTKITGFGGGDGITAYHNNSNPYPVNYNIYENHIWLFYNHGIHVSGSGISIHDNYVDGRADHLRPCGTTGGEEPCEHDVTKSFGHSAIWVGDHRPFPGGDCSRNVTLANNVVYEGWSVKEDEPRPFTRDIGIENYDNSTYLEYGNSGGTNPDGSIHYGSEGSQDCNEYVAPRDPPPGTPLEDLWAYVSPDFYYEFRYGDDDYVGVDTMTNGSATRRGDADIVNDEQLGSVLKLDGNGDFLQIPHHPAFDADRFTIFAIVKPTYQSQPAGQAMQIFSKDDSVHNQRSWQFRLTNDARLELIVFSSPAQPTALRSDPGKIPAGVWSYVAATYDGSNLRLYYAPLGQALQVLGATPFSGPVANSTAAAYIGRAETANPGYFSGRIDDVAFFKRALTGTEEVPTSELESVIQWGHMIVPDNELAYQQ